jgi:CheY-like chemotaxis protein
VKGKLFIFEDSDIEIKLYQAKFKDVFECTFAKTFSNAIYTLENASGFDAYIIDVYDANSRFNGTELVDLIKSDKIIFVTAFDMHFQMREKYKKLHYMQKPIFNYQKLIELIKNVINENPER